MPDAVTWRRVRRAETSDVAAGGADNGVVRRRRGRSHRRPAEGDGVIPLLQLVDDRLDADRDRMRRLILLDHADELPVR